MTEEEKIICKQFLNDADKTHSCNEYKLLMALVDQEPNYSEIPTSSTTETLISLDVYKQVAWERDIAIEQLHELGYEFGQKIDPTTKNDCETCIHNKGVLECDMYGCKYEPTTKNDLGVDAVSRKALIDWLKNWTLGDNSPLIDFVNSMPPVTSQKPRKGEWLRMSDLSEQEDDRYKCSRCGNVIHHKNKMDLYTFNSWCGRCGSDNGRH